MIKFWHVPREWFCSRGGACGGVLSSLDHFAWRTCISDLNKARSVLCSALLCLSVVALMRRAGWCWSVTVVCKPTYLKKKKKKLFEWSSSYTVVFLNLCCVIKLDLLCVGCVLSPVTMDHTQSERRHVRHVNHQAMVWKIKYTLPQWECSYTITRIVILIIVIIVTTSDEPEILPNYMSHPSFHKLWSCNQMLLINQQDV